MGALFRLPVLPSAEAPSEARPLTREQSRSRRKHGVRARTVSIKRMTKREIELGRLLFPDDELAANDAERPRTRAECECVPRPCPYVACLHNLYLDIAPGTGAIKRNFPDREPDEMPADGSCALDVAEAGGVTLERTGELMNMTRERVRQVEVVAFARVKRRAGPEYLELAEAGERTDARSDAFAQSYEKRGGGGRSPASSRAGGGE